MKPGRNGILDLHERQIVETDEEKAIVAHRDASADFNIYYVHDFQQDSDTGLVNHTAVGLANPSKSAAFVRDAAANKLYVTAHEVGHLHGLEHADLKTYLGTPNPTYLDGTDPKKRLMYYREQSGVAPTLLVKPERDIVRKN